MSYTSLLTHIVFSTKERRAFLTDRAIRNDVHAYLGGIIRNLRGTAFAVGGIADHVHLLIRLPAALPVADAVRVIKTNSTAWIHEKRPELAHFSWQTKYSAFSVSPSAITRVVHYINSQET